MSQENKIEAKEEPSFQKSLDQFINFSEEVLKYNLSGDLILKVSKTNTNLLLSSLKGYRKIYEKTRQSSKHLEKFNEVYMKCRSKILKDDLDDFMDWFQKQNFVITPKEKSRNKIMLVVIFRNCCRVAEKVVEEAENHPNDRERYDNDPAALYPEQFMLHLFRLFSFGCDKSDKEKNISPKIEELEDLLGLSKNETPASSDGLADLLSAAGDVAKDIGIDMPSLNGISTNQIKEALGQFTQNDAMRNQFKEAFGGMDLQNPQGLPGALGKILERMQENARIVPEPVQRSLNASTNTQ